MRRTVGEVMTREVVTVKQTASLREAHALLREHGFHHLCVVDEEGELVGVMSDRDVARALSSPLARHGGMDREQVLDGLMAARAMHGRPLTVTPEAPVEAAIRVMLQNRIHCVPVVRAGRLLGILTQSDCLELCTELLEESRSKRASQVRQASAMRWSEVL